MRHPYLMTQYDVLNGMGKCGWREAGEKQQGIVWHIRIMVLIGQGWVCLYFQQVQTHRERGALVGMGLCGQRLVDIQTKGGMLSVSFSDTSTGYEAVVLQGPATPVFKGQWETSTK